MSIRDEQGVDERSFKHSGRCARSLIVVQPDDSISSISLRDAAKESQRSSKEFAQRHLIRDYDPSMLHLPVSIKFIQQQIITNVVRQDSPALLNRVLQLLGVAFSSTGDLEDMNGVIASLP